MPRTATLSILTKLLDQSSRPIYVIDAERRIVYCNPALAAWLDLESARIVGRVVEYHSEAVGITGAEPNQEIPLTELCPPPRALSGEPCVGTISCLARGGSLVHRQAEFVPLDAPPTAAATGNRSRRRPAGAVLVLLAASDLTPAELSSTLSGDPQADELHCTIRQFRRTQSAAYAVNSLLGNSAAMRKVRAQVAAAASSGANCLICGPRGSGRGHVARAIHYHATPDPASKLIAFDCALMNDDLLRRALDVGVPQPRDTRDRPTLLLENLEFLAAGHQAQLLSAIRQNMFSARIVATICSRHAPRAIAVGPPSRGGPDTANNSARLGSPQNDVPLGSRHLPAGKTPTEPVTLEPALLDALSTITIDIPSLAQRLDDLPALAQCFLESCNRGSDKQIGSVRREALDLLALYSWPGELDELRAVIIAAHRASSSHEISHADLPPVIHHAAQAAARSPRRAERIVLDELLITIEKEAIVRAMAQARGNKTEAADLLGMTRPRLYRRLVQLGLVAEPTFNELASPEFIEQDPTENSS